MFGNTSAMRNQDNMILRKKKYHLSFQQKFKEKQNIIPYLFSFNDVWRGYNALSKKKKEYVNHNIKQSLLVSFAMCPKEIRHKILTIMLDHDIESAHAFDTKPILEAFKYYEYVKSYAPLKISNKEYSAGTLFRYSKKEVEQIHGVSRPFALIEKMIDAKTSIISEKTFKTILLMKNKEIIQDLKLRIVRDEYVEGCVFGPIMMSTASLFVYPILSLPIAMGFTCCLEGLFFAAYYHRASLDAIEVEL